MLPGKKKASQHNVGKNNAKHMPTERERTHTEVFMLEKTQR